MHATAERPDLGFDFRVTSLRMFSVYGPGQSFSNPYQGVLGIFLGKLMRGEPITIFGDGEQTRDFVYIDDIVEGWVRALNTPAAAGGVFNLGSGRSLSINELAARGYRGVRPSARRLSRSTAPRRGRASSAPCRPIFGLAASVLGWRAADDLRSWACGDGPLGARRSSRATPRPSPRGSRCAMKLLLVIWCRPVDAQRVHGPQVRRRRPGAGARGRRLRPGRMRSCRRCRSRPI